MIFDYKEWISDLKSLKALGMDDNHIVYVGEEIGKLTNLTTLNLADNVLQQIPPSISNIISLKSINLENNHLTYIPDEFSTLTNLQSLYLDDNDINQLPPFLLKLNSLIELRYNYSII